MERLWFEVPTMNCEDARLGMRQAARDLASGDLPASDEWALYIGKIQRGSSDAFRTAAWMRGYLLIALLKRRIDRATADKIARSLMRQHYVIDWFPSNWEREARVRFPKVNDLVRAALRYSVGS